VEPDEDDQARAGTEAFSEYVKQIKPHINSKVRVALVTDKALWTEAQDPALKDMIAKNPNSELVYFGKIGRDATDFTAELSQIRRARAHLIFGVSGFGASIPFTKQWSQLKIPALVTGTIIIAMSPSAWIGALGVESAAYTGSNCYGFPAVDNRTADMIKRAKEKFGHDPTHATCGGWVMAMAYIETIKKAKTLDADALVKTLEKVVIPAERSYGGTLAFDTDHRAKFGRNPQGVLDGIYLVWYEYGPDGKTVIVSPSEVAKSKILIPDYMKTVWKSWK
jgi:branched-chain amino acid transport system substrate-binding protein